MANVLFVGKPIEPPWNDSSKNLARDLVVGMHRHVPVLLGREPTFSPSPRARVEPLFGPAATGFSPALGEKAKLFGRLARSREDVAHFFFAPNLASSSAARLVLAMRRMPSVHTLCSAPREGIDLRRVLFADVQVVLSRATERRLLDAGIAADRVRRIPPSIPALDVPSDDARRAARRALGLPTEGFLVVYPGDLEFGRGAPTMIEAIASMSNDFVLAMACRTKTEAAREQEARLRALARTLGAESRVSWVGETRRIHDLLGAADVVALPSDTLYAKMDYPLVLLEAMAQERPVLVGAGTAAEELADGGAALAARCDVDAVVGALQSLASDPVVARAFGRIGRAKVLTDHTVHAMGAAYESLYDHLLAAH